MMKGKTTMKNITKFVRAAFAVLTCLALWATAQAVVPPPDGGYPGANTAEGQNALFSRTTGGYNTALGYFSLRALTTSNFNTATGAYSLYANLADQNTATGTAALFANTTGGSNTANGAFALFSNTTGAVNTAIGNAALQNNTTGSFNTANGAFALFSNTTGQINTALGFQALQANTIGGRNCAVGNGTLSSLTTGDSNTGIGNFALANTQTGGFNTALGRRSLTNNSGNLNVGLGYYAGHSLTTGDNNIIIDTLGAAAESNTIRIGCQVPEVLNPDGTMRPAHQATYIAGISGQTAADGVAVYINSDGKLGTLTSSARFKTDIKPMDKSSEAVFALKPVSFHYKSDSKGTPKFGLIAEEVAEVNPDLVVRDRKGEIYSVRYEAVDVMLLNEFLKEHRKVEQLTKDFESKLAEQQRQIEALTAGLQKVSAQIEMSRSAPQVVDNR
jgi:hypothetical protein